MGFSVEWDDIYKKNRQMSVWPWSDLISYVKRYANLKEGDSVLELGCGVGANIPFFTGFSDIYYHAIEGSKKAVQLITVKFPEAVIYHTDFTKDIPLSETGQLYNLIVDRAAVIHNRISDIRRTIDNIEKVIASDGVYIGIDWFNQSHSAFVDKSHSLFYEDEPATLYKTELGPFVGLGNVHFTSKEELVSDLWKNWKISNLQFKMVTDIDTNYSIGSYNFVAIRR